MVHKGREEKNAEIIKETKEVVIAKQEQLETCNKTRIQKKILSYDKESNLKKELIKYYEPPKPQRKQAFIRQMGVQKINVLHLAGMQIKYISKWVWIVSVVFCMLFYAITYQLQEKFNGTFDKKLFGTMLAFLPVLVMFSLTESMRSYRYGMEELELSTRFSLKSIVMARLLILGVENLLVLLFVSILFGNKMEFSIWYMLAPYFITTSSGLHIVRTIRGSENNFFCFLLAGIVSMLQMILPWQLEQLFLPKYVPLWMIVCIVGMIATIKESYRTIQMTEELAWN